MQLHSAPAEAFWRSSGVSPRNYKTAGGKLRVSPNPLGRHAWNCKPFAFPSRALLPSVLTWPAGRFPALQTEPAPTRFLSRLAPSEPQPGGAPSSRGLRVPRAASCAPGQETSGATRLHSAHVGAPLSPPAGPGATVEWQPRRCRVQRATRLLPAGRQVWEALPSRVLGARG